MTLRSTTPATASPATSRPVASRRQLLLGSSVLALGVGLAGCAPKQPTVSGPTDVDIGFCTDMAFHHEQALAMCQRVLGRDTGEPVQASAAEILQNQSYERGQMHAWLAGWGESTAPPATVMGWMGMSMPASGMHGLASDADMRRLADTQGLAKGRLFLQLMRAHHVGGVAMADVAAAGAATAEVTALAGRMSQVQSYEIGVFDTLLSGDYQAM